MLAETKQQRGDVTDPIGALATMFDRRWGQAGENGNSTERGNIT